MPQLLVGAQSGDDAAVYRIDDHQALILTADFITPVCDDAFLYGQVAASNAMSDVYAMGGKVLLGINICAFPAKKLPRTTYQQILQGAADKMQEVGAVVAGGHTVKDDELKYGLAVVGRVDPQKLVTNAAARVGDRLLLTKPVGAGAVLAHANKRKNGERRFEAVFESMCLLNEAAVTIMHDETVHACTDVTGFGVALHAAQMAEASGVGLEIYASKVPQFNGALELIDEFGLPAAGTSNRKAMKSRIQVDEQVSEAQQALCFDPQTSGGLLMSVAAEAADKITAQLRQAGYLHVAQIGKVVAKNEQISLLQLKP